MPAVSSTLDEAGRSQPGPSRWASRKEQYPEAETGAIHMHRHGCQGPPAESCNCQPAEEEHKHSRSAQDSQGASEPGLPALPGC